MVEKFEYVLLILVDRRSRAYLEHRTDLASPNHTRIHVVSAQLFSVFYSPGYLDDLVNLDHREVQVRHH